MKGVPLFTPLGEKPVLFQPGAESGPEWPPAAYSPRTKFVYVPAGGYEPWLAHSIPGAENTIGSTLDAGPKYNAPDQYGLLDALDTTTGKIAWKLKTKVKTLSGLAVAGDLVFFGDSDGTFMALDARSGKVLWRYKSSEKNVGGANGTAAVYMVNGREYVVMGFGGNFRQRADVGDDNSPVGDAYIAFALPQAGKAEPHRVIAHPRQLQGRLVPEGVAIRTAGSATPPRGARVIEIKMHDYNFDPNTITARPGEKITVHLVNTDPVAGFGFVIDLPTRPLALVGHLGPGESKYVAFTAPSQPGDYEFYSLTGNAERFFGMTGTLRVTGSSH
jgi:alcohol dehydrogenase (cytochrome c)